MTVSRALNRPEIVADDTRHKILEVCERLNYRPNANARSLRTNTSHQVGVIIPDWRNAFWIDVVSGIEAVLTGAGFQLLIANSNEQGRREELQIEAMLSQSVDGLLIAPSDGAPSGDSLSRIDELLAAGMPLVIIDRLPAGIANVSCVTIDNESGAYKATRHLLSAGHRRIGLLAGNINLDTGQQRVDGYLRGLKEPGLAVDEQLIRTAETNAALVGREVGFSSTLEFLDMDNAPTALLCTSNTIAIGAIAALQERRVQIPEEMAIVSFGDMEWTTLLSPPLTVITQPTIEMGRQAGLMLLEYLEDVPEDGHKRHRKQRRIVLEPQLIVRASSVRGAAAKTIPDD